MYLSIPAEVIKALLVDLGEDGTSTNQWCQPFLQATPITITTTSGSSCRWRASPVQLDKQVEHVSSTCDDITNTAATFWWQSICTLDPHTWTECVQTISRLGCQVASKPWSSWSYSLYFLCISPSLPVPPCMLSKLICTYRRTFSEFGRSRIIAMAQNDPKEVWMFSK